MNDSMEGGKQVFDARTEEPPVQGRSRREVLWPLLIASGTTLLGATVGFAGGVSYKAHQESAVQREATHRANLVRVNWRKVPGFSEQQTEVVRFSPDPDTKVRRTPQDCTSVGVIGLSTQAAKTQITDKGYQVGVAWWSTGSPDTAHVGLLGSTSQMGRFRQQLSPSEASPHGLPDVDDMRTVGARVCNQTLVVSIVGIDQQGGVHGLQGVEQITQLTLAELGGSPHLSDTPVV